VKYPHKLHNPAPAPAPATDADADADADADPESDSDPTPTDSNTITDAALNQPTDLTHDTCLFRKVGNIIVGSIRKFRTGTQNEYIDGKVSKIYFNTIDNLEVELNDVDKISVNDTGCQATIYFDTNKVANTQKRRGIASVVYVFETENQTQYNVKMADIVLTTEDSTPMSKLKSPTDNL